MPLEYVFGAIQTVLCPSPRTLVVTICQFYCSVTFWFTRSPILKLIHFQVIITKWKEKKNQTDSTTSTISTSIEGPPLLPLCMAFIRRYSSVASEEPL